MSNIIPFPTPVKRPINDNDDDLDLDFLVYICILPDGELEININPLAFNVSHDYLLKLLNKARAAIAAELKKK